MSLVIWAMLSDATVNNLRHLITFSIAASQIFTWIATFSVFEI